jgi:hypothetical protein
MNLTQQDAGMLLSYKPGAYYRVQTALLAEIFRKKFRDLPYYTRSEVPGFVQPCVGELRELLRCHFFVKNDPY